MNAKKESEKLMNEVLPLAEKMLRDYGEFYPYGGYLKASGEMVHVGAEDGDTDHPKSRDVLYLLRDSLLTMVKAGDCKATAIVLDVVVDVPGAHKKSNAIQVCLEHADGYSAEVFFPYEVAADGQIIYGQTFAQEGKREIFGERS